MLWETFNLFVKVRLFWRMEEETSIEIASVVSSS